MRLAELLTNTNTTQKALAEYLGMSRAAIGQYSSGKREPDLATLARIADFFGVSVDFLLGRETGERPAAKRPTLRINGQKVTLSHGMVLELSAGSTVIEIRIREALA